MAYLNVEEVEAALVSVSGSQNAAFTELIKLPNLSWEGRQCHAIKIAENSDQDQIGVYFIGGMHAREWGSSDILIFLVEQLTQAYREQTGIRLGTKVFTADQIQHIVNKLEIILFPQVNPDGRNYSMKTEPMWRKNRRPAPINSNDIGVDINRNFGFLWQYPNYFSAKAPVSNSTSPDSEVYIGPSLESEPETQNVIWAIDRFPRIRFMIDVHSYGEKILYNWGDDESQNTNSAMNFMNSKYDKQRGVAGDAYREFIPAHDRALEMNLCICMKNAIENVRGHAYSVESSFGLYPTAGTSIDYAFSRCFTDHNKGKIHSFTIEWGREFQPPYNEMQQIINEVASGLLAFCWAIVESSTEAGGKKA
jgi:carboxypeptidase T